MYILASGTTSKMLSKLITKTINAQGMGVDFNDLLYTLKNNGENYFDEVKTIIITDGALNSLVDISELNELSKLKGNVYFVNRFSNITKTNLLNSKITIINVDEIYLDTLLDLVKEESK